MDFHSKHQICEYYHEGRKIKWYLGILFFFCILSLTKRYIKYNVKLTLTSKSSYDKLDGEFGLDCVIKSAVKKKKLSQQSQKGSTITLGNIPLYKSTITLGNEF